MKKLATGFLITSILGGLILGLTGCGNKEKGSDDGSAMTKEDIEKDVVSKETKEIDGKTVEEYTMKDGSKIQMEK
ncbi:hypothetical protein ACYSNU_18415 [Enterococcus sp. LJL120]|uniref:hypothetical protein n=1 Tax=Enterococcus sp. HY326 TaxID=2971265 RepID=UPI0022402E6D|nr:hypothetical protein [Enterococcus sp. HY326]